jgi:hypothetical protein
MSTKSRYSPAWSSGAFVTRVLQVPDVPTQFDQLVAECGLQSRPDLWPHNDKLRRFAKRNRHIRYVPESYLETLGLDVKDEL